MNPSARVLLVAPIPPPIHGAAMAAKGFLQADYGADVTVHHLDTKFVGQIKELGRFSLGKVGRMVSYCWQLLQMVYRHRINVVVVSVAFKPGAFIKDTFFIVLARLTGAKVVAWYHMHPDALRNCAGGNWFTRFFARVTRLFSAEVFVGKAMTALMPRFIKARHQAVAYNWVPNLPTALPTPAKSSATPRILYLSNLSYCKGVLTVLEAIAKVHATLPNVRFEFYGAPTADIAEAEFVAQLQAHPSRNLLHYGGVLEAEEKWAVLAQASIVVLPSDHEALPMVIQEAMFFGKAVISTPVGAIAEAIEEGKGGYLIPPRDPDALAESIIQLLQHPTLLEQMGHHNQQRAQCLFSQHAIEAQWRGIFSKTLNRPLAPRVTQPQPEPEANHKLQQVLTPKLPAREKLPKHQVA
jgi:glycosyltransferase involved in cell wall biosynthesis